MSDRYVYAVIPAFAESKQLVMQDTWGHLAPEKNKSYKGSILFCKSAFGGGNTSLIDFNFAFLDSSPWLYDFIEEHIQNISNSEDGGIYQINCTIRNYRLYGKPTLLHKLKY
jgi:hypothetical protein